MGKDKVQGLDVGMFSSLTLSVIDLPTGKGIKGVVRLVTPVGREPRPTFGSRVGGAFGSLVQPSCLIKKEGQGK